MVWVFVMVYLQAAARHQTAAHSDPCGGMEERIGRVKVKKLMTRNSVTNSHQQAGVQLSPGR